MVQSHFLMRVHLLRECCGVMSLPKGIPRIYRYGVGEAVGGEHSVKTLKVDSSYKNKLTQDLIPNALGWILLNSRAKEVFEKQINVETEFLPFTLLGQKDEELESHCWIMNIIGTEDCVDLGQTKGLKKDEEHFSEIDELHLLKEKIPAEKNIFRIKAHPGEIVVRADLKEVLEKELKGLTFYHVGEDLILQDARAGRLPG